MTTDPAEPMTELYCAWLTERLTHYLGREIDQDDNLADCGLDSVAALNLYGDVEEAFGPLIDVTDIAEFDTPHALALHMSAKDLRPGVGHQIRVAFAFTGMGAQHPGMTAGLYIEWPGYRDALDEAAQELRPYTGLSMVDLILSNDARIQETAYAQPALFAVGWALARTLEKAGVQPAALIGQGIGEYAAAVLAGALTLPTAARLVAMRGAFMQALPPGGGMLATGISAYEAARLVAAEPLVGIGAINAARSTVLSGDEGGLERIADRLAERGVRTMRLPTDRAYHSPLMEPMTGRFEAVARRVQGAAPNLPFYSTVRGRFTEEPLYAGYWAEQVTAPVRFAEAVRTLLDQQAPTHLVEIGPRPVLLPYLRCSTLGRQPVLRTVCKGPRTGEEHLRKLLTDLRAESTSTLVGS